MSSIQLQILLPDGRSLRQTFAQGPVPFGREADNRLVLAGQYISRQHGVLHQDGDQWLLENLSDNGTWLNGKRVKKKPLTLRPGDVVSIGEQEVLRIEAIVPMQPQPADRATATPTASPAHTAAPLADATNPAPSRQRRRMTLWISLAVFWVVVLGLLVFVQPLLDSRRHAQAAPGVELRPEQITHAVKRRPMDLPARLTPNERLANEHLERARDMASRLDARLDAPYLAYRDYQRAMAYLGSDTLADSQDLHQFMLIESQLVEGVAKRYYDAYAKMRTHNHREAEAAFLDLIRYFPEPANPLIRHVENHRKDLSDALRRRR